MRLSESMNHFSQFVKSIEAVPGDIGDKVKKKMKCVLNKNTVYSELVRLASVLNDAPQTQKPIQIEKKFWIHFLYAPTSSVDAERSFSAFNNIL